MANPIVTSLPAYVEQQRLPLIAKSVLGAKSASMLTLQTGVTGPTALNLVDTAVKLGNGASCGWTDAGSTTLSQRTITPILAKVNMSFCDKALSGKWAQSQIRIAAGQAVLPFEEEFVMGVVDGVKAEIERMIWQGDADNAQSNVEFDGFLKLMEADSKVIDVAIPAGTNAYNAIKSVYAKIPANAFAEDTVIFVGMDLYRNYIQELVSANLYHFNPMEGDGEYKLPGTDTRVVGVNGLNGTNKIVAGRLSEMFYGTDMENDEEIFDLWYSRDNQEFRLSINFTAGVQYAFGENIVLGAIANA